MAKFQQWTRKSHAWVGIFSAITLGIIAISCFPIAHKWDGFGKTLADIHMGKFLPNAYRWIWIDSQGLLLLGLVVSGWLMHRSPSRRAARKKGEGGLLILFGSQTGNGEALAMKLHRKLLSAGCANRVAGMSENGFFDLSKEDRLCLICSTTGDGEMPENATALWESLSRSDAPLLPNLQYAVLGLGDRSYARFNSAAVAFDRRLVELGARRVCDSVLCDADYSKVSSEWIARMCTQFGGSEHAVTEGSGVSLTANCDAVKVAPSVASAPVLISNTPLTLPGSFKETRHLEIAFPGVQYRPGDLLGVHPHNCHALVEQTLEAAGFDGEEAVPSADGRLTLSLRKALLEQYEISRISQDLWEAVCQRSNEPLFLDLKLSEEAGRNWCSGREVVDLLLASRCMKWNAADFVALLDPLKPRLYSIASSPSLHGETLNLAVGVLRYEAHGLARKGVCSTFLADRVRCGSGRLGVFLQTHRTFHMPAESDRPMIMVGPGTGVAPFRGFLAERHATGAAGKNWLFFGEQRGSTDFFYRDELETYQQEGTLHRLSTAFSRETKHRVYVQDRLKAEGADVWKWIGEGAAFYVCGSKAMGLSVETTLQELAMEHGGIPADKVAEWLQKQSAEGLYRKDLY